MTAKQTSSSFARTRPTARPLSALVWGAAALSLLLTLLAPSAGEAQRRRRPAPPPEVVEQPGEASRRAAQAAFAAGDFVEAERLYAASLAEQENAVVYIGLADARERQQNPQGAVTALERYLELRPDAPDRAAVEARVAALRALRGVVLVTAEPPGEVWLDGERTGYVTPVELTLAPGSHGIAVTVRGEMVAEHAVDVPFGGRTTLALVEGAVAPTATEGEGEGVASGEGGETVATTEAPAEEPAPAPGEPTLEGDGVPLDEPADDDDAARESSYEPRRAAGISASIAAGTLVMGTVLGFMALTEQSDFDARPTEASADRGERLALFSDVMFGVAGIAAVTSIVLYVTDKRAARRAEASAEAARLRLVPLAGRQGAGMRATLAF